MSGNPSAFGKVKPKHVKPSPRAAMVSAAATCADHLQASFRYTQDDPERRELFDLGRTGILKLLAGQHAGHVNADCSQFYAALATHVGGVKGLSHFDYTGTLLAKGKHVPTPEPADCVIFGGGTGEHAAMVTFNGYCIGFGHWPGAPNRVKLADMIAYFQHTHPGVRYLSFLP